MTKKDLTGRRAMVTGASSGLGVAFAKQLAARGASLVITARRKDNLDRLAEELRQAHGTEVIVIGLDLADPSSARELFDRTEGAGIAIDVLVNNAGGGFHAYFADSPWEKIRTQIQLNLVTLTELTWLFSRKMLERRTPSYILNVASIGAYSPSPTYAVYSATKAFVRDMSEAIAFELRDTPVRVCSLCPGGTETEFHLAAEHDLPKAFRSTFMSAEDCARIGIDAVLRGRRNIISGWMNKVGMWMMRFLPRRTIVWLAATTMGRPRFLPSNR